MVDETKIAETLAEPGAAAERTADPAVATVQLATITEIPGDAMRTTPLPVSPTLPPPPAGDPDQAGHVVARRYRLHTPIGRGAHGRVWECADLLTGERVALKLMRAEHGRAAARMRREVASMRLLRLSGVVQLLDEGTEDGRPFLVMERVHGEPFPGLPLPVSWDQLAPTAFALLETLSRMHAAGIVHRDLKPANVLVDAGGRPMILDFGLARADSSLDEGVTDHGSILGTPAYLAPEQVLGEPPTARSDLYAFAVMVFQALSGGFPHPLDNVMRMLRARVTDPPRRLGEAAPGVPAEVGAVVDALLSRQPADRPRSAEEVLRRLRGWEAPPVHRGVFASLAPGSPPLGEEALRALFTGTSRLFHVPEDAARLVHRRTDGHPARVLEEVSGWIQAGVARWDGERVAVDRDVLSRLAAGLLITPAAPLPTPDRPLPRHLDELLGWILLAHPHAHAAELAVARRTAPAFLADDLAALEAEGAVRLLPGGRVEPLRAPGAGDSWPLEARRAVHRRIAMAEPPGTPRRLYHLVAGADDDAELGYEIAAEALCLGRRLAVEGHLSLAFAAVCEGLRAERRTGFSSAAASIHLLALAVEIALEDGTPGMLDRALYELHRVEPRSPAVDRLAGLLRAALAVGQRTERAFVEASEIEPFVEVDLERRRQELRVVAARLQPPADQERLLAEVRAWALRTGDAVAQGAASGWLGRLRYRQGRYAEAAAAHAAAASSHTWATARLGALLLCASARLEAYELDGAASAAEEARDLALRHRLPSAEARAEWILRGVAYRSAADPAPAPDPALVEAAALVRVGDIEALIALGEAALAFRAGDHPLSAALSLRARRAWTTMGEVSRGGMLATALAFAAGAELGEDEARAVVERALTCPDAELGLQALGLMAMSGRAHLIDPAGAGALAAGLTRDQPGRRYEVLSAREALAAIRSRGERSAAPPSR